MLETSETCVALFGALVGIDSKLFGALVGIDRPLYKTYKAFQKKAPAVLAPLNSNVCQTCVALCGAFVGMDRRLCTIYRALCDKYLVF